MTPQASKLKDSIMIFSFNGLRCGLNDNMDICVPRLISREPYYVSMDIRVDGCKRAGFVIMYFRVQCLNSRKTYV